MLLASAAATLAATTAYNVYRARKTEREHPPAGQFVTVDGVRLHYIELGRGSPVVLIHGNLVTSDDFLLSGLLERIGERHRVIAFDRPGFGYSDRPRGSAWGAAAQADLLREAFAMLGIEPAVVLGHSWGATVAATLALNHPDAVRGLVLLSGYYYPTLRADTLPAATGAVPVLGDVLRFSITPLVGAAVLPGLFKGMFAPLPVPARFARGYPHGMSVRPGQIWAESQDGAAMIPAALATKSRYGELDMPVVIMAGTEDRVVNVDRHAIRLHLDVPHSLLLLVPDVGHMVHYAAPERVAEAVEFASGQTAHYLRPAFAA
jgi:pimeloyl-ACP methyl ester carboxylesterase